MIASRLVAANFQGRNALDLPVATLAGLSAAFLIYAMPSDLLSELVASTGIAAWVPAAESPLGGTARAAIGSAAALGTFVIAFLLMRALDRVGAGRPSGLSRALVGRYDELESSTLRLRRRDSHPDAPSRRPLMATLELGDPQAPSAVPVDRSGPAPAWLQPAAIDPNTNAEQEVRAPDPAGSRSTPAGPTSPQTRFSLDELMERLEQGLARRRVKVETILADPIVALPADDRLQTAIESLHRFAARQQD